MAPSTDNLTVVLHKMKDVRLENRPIPEPKDDEVLIQMGRVGICGSDVHYVEHGRISDFIVREPMILGHEASGTVVKVGKNVSNLKEGDRVAIEPGVPCRKCDLCRTGRYNLCTEVVFCATPPHHGNLARYYCHVADYCFKLPDHVTLEEGALLEPLSVGVHACRRGGVVFGSTVLVLGAGPIGLVTTLSAKAMGATKIMVIDILENNLKMAKTCGADLTLKINRDDNANDLAKKIAEAMGEQPQISIDCAGFNNTINIGISATKPGGVFVLVGMGANEVTVPLVNASIREVDIKGVFRYCNDYPLALAMVASGKIDVKPLITHNFRLDESLKAFETASKGLGNPIKIMIHCDK